MHAYIEILRPHNAAMSVIAVFTGWILIMGLNQELLAPQLLTAILSVFLIFGAGNVINDYADFECDKINRPKRPLSCGRVSKRAALIYTATLFGTGIFLAWLVNTVTFLIALVNTLVLIGYSTTLQNKIYLGNLAIAYLVGSTFVFGGAATGSTAFLKLPLMLMLLSSLSTLAREIIKDLEDVEGDRKSFLKRLSKRAGRLDRFRISKGETRLNYDGGKAKVFAAASLLAAVLASPLPFFTGALGFMYVLALLPADAVFMFAFYSILISKGRNYSWISKVIKTGMLLALLAFVAGILF